MAGQVDSHRGAAGGQGHGVPGARALARVVQEHQLRRPVTPEHPAHVAAGGNAEPETRLVGLIGHVPVPFAERAG